MLGVLDRVRVGGLAATTKPVSLEDQMCRVRREIKPYCLLPDSYDPSRLVLP
jgi:hypothetical protein